MFGCDSSTTHQTSQVLEVTLCPKFVLPQIVGGAVFLGHRCPLLLLSVALLNALRHGARAAARLVSLRVGGPDWPIIRLLAVAGLGCRVARGGGTGARVAVPIRVPTVRRAVGVFRRRLVCHSARTSNVALRIRAPCLGPCR